MRGCRREPVSKIKTMSEHSIDVTQGEFAARVLEASRHAPVVVDFWAPWCGPCKVLGPILERLATDFAGSFLLAKVNTDENQELAVRYGVRGIPNVKAFVDGKVVDEFTGVLSESEVRQFLEGILPSPAAPLRGQAQDARARGRLAQAQALLMQAIQIDPSNAEVQLDLAELQIELRDLERARSLLAGRAPDFASQRERFESLRAKLELAEAAQGAEPSDLAARVANEPSDLDARLKLAQALAVREDYRAAFEQLLQIVQKDRSFRDDVGRRTMLSLFQMLGNRPEAQELVREYRTALARTLH